MTVRATAHGADRHSLDGTSVDVLICGASFAGLAVARELADCGASVLMIDRYRVGERATSACAAPTPWLRALGLDAAIRQEISHMRFTTPHGSVRYRLPWTWSSFDYRHLRELLYAQADARFHTATVQARVLANQPADRGAISIRTDRRRAARAARRVGVASCAPADHVRRPTVENGHQPRPSSARQRSTPITAGLSPSPQACSGSFPPCRRGS